MTFFFLLDVHWAGADACKKPSRGKAAQPKDMLWILFALQGFDRIEFG